MCVTEVFGVRCTPLAIPVATSAVAAGWPSPAEDYLDGHLDLSELLIQHPAATFFVRAAGSSMIGEGIHDDDLLVVDRSRTPRDGQIIIALLDGEFLVKTYRTEGTPRLVAASPNYPDIPLAGRDMTVWGVVTCVLHFTL